MDDTKSFTIDIFYLPWMSSDWLIASRLSGAVRFKGGSFK